MSRDVWTRAHPATETTPTRRGTVQGHADTEREIAIG